MFVALKIQSTPNIRTDTVDKSRNKLQYICIVKVFSTENLSSLEIRKLI